MSTAQWKGGKKMWRKFQQRYRTEGSWKPYSTRDGWARPAVSERCWTHPRALQDRILSLLFFLFSRFPPSSLWETIQKKRLTTSGKRMPGTAWWCWRWGVSRAATNREEGGKNKGKKINRVRYFHILVLYLIIICSKKARGTSWKICQQYSISPSSALYFLCLLSSGSCFPPINTLKKNNLHASLHGHRLVKIQILRHWNCCRVSLFLAPTDLRASTYLPQADMKRPAKSITLKIPRVSSKRKMTPWMAGKDAERASISKSSKISQWQRLLSIQKL